MFWRITMQLKLIFIIFTIFLHFSLLYANTAPTITSTAVTTTNEDITYSYVLDASDADDDSLIWSVTEGTDLPSWLTPTFEWEQLGDDGFTSDSVNYLDLALDANNTPYVAFQDSDDEATVMKYDGSDWVLVGDASFSASSASSASTVFGTHIQISSEGAPYVIYRDYRTDTGHGATVMKYDGSDWVAVGEEGFSPGSASDPDIAFDSNDNLYAVFEDNENDSKATVMKYLDSNDSWEVVGSVGFSEGDINYPDIAFDSSDTPYIAFEDEANGGKITVMKYEDSTWSIVGSAGISEDDAWYPRVVFDSSDTPYVSYRSNGSPDATGVQKFNGSEWVYAGGDTTVTDAYSYYPDIAISPNDVVYTAFYDITNKMIVYRYSDDNDTWTSVGIDITENRLYNNNIEIGSDYSAYVVARDTTNDGKAVGMKGKITGLTGTPTNDDVGTYSISMTLSDGVYSQEYNFTITVSNVNDVPVITSTEITSVDEDSAYSYTLDATDDEDDTLTWSVADGTSLPSWLTLTPQSSWEVVGEAGFTTSSSRYYDLAFDSNNTPYVAYSNGTNDNAMVQKYDGSAWVNVGEDPLSTGTTAYQSIVIDSNDTKYVAFGNTEATVMKYIDANSSWELVGDEKFSSGSASDIHLALDNNDTLYIVYYDSGNSNKATVMKYDGSSWVAVGTEGFSDGKAYYTDIAFDSSNTPYVCFKDFVNDKKVTVMKYDGSDWVSVGDAGFSSGAVGDAMRMAIDSQDTPYVVYADGANSDKATLVKYNGSKWTEVGDAGFSDGDIEHVGIAIDGNDIPYVLYTENLDSGETVTVKKYDGSNWMTVGNSAVSSYNSWYSNIALDNEGIPYVVHGDTNEHYAGVVLKLDPSALTGTPADADIGTHDVNLTLSDGTDTLEYNFQITVVSTNSDPTAANSTVTATEDETYTFSSGDFNFADVDVGDMLEAVYITSLPSTGDLQYNGLDVKVDDKITTFSSLTYTPLENENGSSYTSFGFKVNDGEANSTTPYTMTIDVDALNDAPTVTSTAITSIDEDSNYSYILKGNDIDGDSISWSVSDGTTLSSWLNLTAQDYWQSVGDAGDYTQNQSEYLNIAIDSKGTPYIAYSEKYNNYNIVVMKYTEANSSWNLVGSSGFNGDSAYHIDFAFDSNDVPYVVLAQSDTSSKATVMKYTDANNSWDIVGTPNFTSDLVSRTSMAIDSHNTPYVAYVSRDFGYISVMKYDGSDWVLVGDAQFSPIFADNLTIAIDSNDTPYVLYRDYEKSSKATVMKFDGSGWVTVGSRAFSANNINDASMAFDSNDTPYVVYTASGTDEKASVEKYDGSDWATVGSSGFSEGEVDGVDIIIGSDGTPYVTYQDKENGNKATVMKYNGTAWSAVGTVGFSIHEVQSTKIVLDSSDTPYVLFQDTEYNNTASVMKLVQSELSGTPTNDDLGVHDINLTLSDGNLTTEHNFQITVNNTNDAPSASDNTISVDEDTNYSFSSSDFNFSDVDSGDTLNTIYITSLVDKGSLMLNAVDVTLNQEIGIADIANLIYTPEANENGSSYTSFGFVVNDGDANSTSSYTITIDVNEINDAPSVTSTEVSTVNEDNVYSYILEASDLEDDSLTWSVASGTTLPTWLTLHSSSSLWENVGDAGFSSGTAIYTDISIGSDNSVYVVYQDGNNDDKATVMMCDGNSWATLGTAGFSTGSTRYTHIALDSDDTPYVVYQDDNQSSKASVMKYNGSDWVSVGEAGFSADMAIFTEMAFDSNDTPYVVFADGDNSYKTTVMKYDGTNWGIVGDAGFSDGMALYTTIALDGNDTPYVVYSDVYNNDRITVMKYESNSWSVVGSAAFSTGTSDYTDIAFDSNNAPYVVFSDENSEYKATVMKYESDSWSVVGSAGISSDGANYTRIAIDAYNNIYVVFKDTGVAGKAVVMQYSGDTWETLGTAGFSAGIADETSIALDKYGNPYVVYPDSAYSSKATVMKFAHSALYGIPTNDEVGVHDVNLTLSDGTETLEYNFEITVNNTDDAPNLESIDDTITLEDTNLTIALSATDIDGDSIVYSAASNDTTIATVSVIDSELVVSPVDNMSGTITITVDASANGVSDTKTFTLDVTAVDDAPYFTSTLDSQSIDEDSASYSLVLSRSAADVEGDSFTYTAKSNDTELVSVVVSGNSGITITPQANAYGTTTIDVNVTQDSNSSLYDSYSFTITVEEVNDAPTITSTSEDITLNEDDGVTNYDLNVSDIEGDDLNITVDSNDTSIITVSPNWDGWIDQATWTQGLDYNLTNVADANGKVQITITVDDGEDNTTQTFDIDVTALNDAPILSSIADITISEDENYTIELSATDVDNDTLNYTVEIGDSGIASVILNGSSLSITPTMSGETLITATVNDGVSEDVETFTLSVTAVEQIDPVETVDNGDGTSTTSVANGSETTDETTTSITYPNGSAIDISENDTDTQVTLYDPAVEIVVSDNGSLDVNVTNSSDGTTNNVTIASLGVNVNISDEKDTVITLPETINQDSKTCNYTIEFDYESDVVTTYQYINKGLDNEILTTLIIKIPESSVDITDESKVIHTANYTNSNNEEFSVVGEVDCLGTVVVATTNVSDNNSTTIGMDVAASVVIIESNGDTSIVNSYINPDSSQEIIEVDIAMDGESGNSNITKTKKDTTTQKLIVTTTNEYLLGATINIDSTGISEVGLEISDREVSVTLNDITASTIIDESINHDAFSILKEALKYVIEIFTTNGADITIENYLDATAKYIFTLNDVDTSVTSEIAGADVNVTDTDITMVVEQSNKVDGENFYKAYVHTDANGKTTAQFMLYDSNANQLDTETVNNPFYKEGNSVNIYESNGEMFIKTTTKIDGNIEF